SYSCHGCIRSQPSSELVASSRELGAVRSHGIIFEIDFLTGRWLRSGMSTHGIALELDNRARSVHVRALVESVSVRIRSTRSRTTDAKCYDTQCNGRGY